MYPPKKIKEKKNTDEEQESNKINKCKMRNRLNLFIHNALDFDLFSFSLLLICFLSRILFS